MKIARKKPKWELDGSNIITIIKTSFFFAVVRNEIKNIKTTNNNSY